MLYFKLQELVSKDVFDQLGAKAWLLFYSQALLALEDLREFFDVRFFINNWNVGGQLQQRGYRTPQKARELGSSHSSHAFTNIDGTLIPICNAFDIDIEGYTADRARRIMIAHKNDPLLKRIMRVEGGVSWLHFDLAPVPENKRIYVFRA